MPDMYDLPEDISALSADDLATHIEQASESFRNAMNDPELTDADLPALAAYGARIKELKSEFTAREEAAAAARAELEALSADVLGEDPASEASEEQAVEEVAEEAEETVAASARPVVKLNAVRKTVAPQIMPPAPAPEAKSAPALEIKAAMDVPGHRPGHTMDFADLVPGAIARAQSLQSQGGGSALVASYSHVFPDELIVPDAGDAGAGATVSEYAASQRRLKGGDLVAAGGWCAPSETMYDFLNLSCPDMLWDAPEIQLRRGGLRYFPTPVLDVAAMTFLHTEAADIAGTPKPCYNIPCPDPIEVRCDAVGICVRAGLLTQRHFPELIESQLSLAMIAQEIRVRQTLLNALAAGATAVTAPARFGTVGVLYNAIALHAADLIERLSLCGGTPLEVVLPWWSKNMMLADVALRNGVSLEEVTVADVQAIFTPLGVRVQWARGILDVPFPQDNDPANNEIGGTTPAADWPDNLQFLIYPSGQVQIGRGAEINLGVVYDHASLQQNLATMAFAEECVALVNRAPAGTVRLVTVPICASGTTGGQTVITCA